MPHPPPFVERLNRRSKRPNARVSFERAAPFGPNLVVHRYRLGNGLDVSLMLDKSAPVVSYQTWYRVGSRHEKKGKTGLAHLFEHLMFNETKKLPAGEFDRLLEAAGGESNAATWTDWTYYYENLPSNSLELAVRLESERMHNLVLREPQVASEKEVVANERRYRVDDDVEGAATERLFSLAYTKHPYSWPTIGWMKDIEGFTVEDCRAFYRTYYAPNNACLVVVGDFDEEETLALLQKHYGKLSSSKIPKPRAVTEPPQRSERRDTMKKPTTSEKVLIGYRSPPFGSTEYAVLTVANEILVGGRSSRLYRKLIADGEIASELRASLSPFRDPGLYEIWASARSEHTAKKCLSVIDAELARLTKTMVGRDELEKAKNRLELAFLQGMETASGKAEQIGFFLAVTGDAGRVFGQLEEFRAVTPEAIKRAAQKYLDPRRRSVVTVLPDGST